MKKGIKIALSGELVISQIKDEQTGTASHYTEVIMDNVEFAEAKTKKEKSDGFQPAEKRTSLGVICSEMVVKLTTI